MADLNLNPAAFPFWNAGLRGVRAGTGPAKLLFVGNSTEEGNSATAISNTMPRKLQALQAARLTAAVGAVWGPSAQYTNEVTLGTGWAGWNIQGIGPLGSLPGNGFTAATSATGLLSVPLAHSIDRIVVNYARTASSGTFTTDVDGGASLGSINTQNGISAIGKTTLTCAAGVHTINIHPPTGGTVFILSVEGYLSTAPQVLFSNGGRGTATTAYWVGTANPWSALLEIDLYQPTLSIVSLGINDGINGVSDTTYNTNMGTLIDKLQLYGDVLLCTPIPGQTDPAKSNILLYNAKLASLAVAKNCGLVDLTLAGRFVDWTTANGNGYMSDAFHPNDAGYAFWAGILNTAVQQITASTGLLGLF